MNKDISRSDKTPATGPDAGNIAIVDSNLKIALALNIPVFEADEPFSLNGAKDVAGYIAYKKETGFAVYDGTAWNVISSASTLNFINGITKTVNDVGLGGNAQWLYPSSVIIGDPLTNTRGSAVFNTGTASILSGNITTGNYRELSAGLVGVYMSAYIGGIENKIIIDASTGVMTVINSTAQRGLGDSADWSATKQPLDYATKKMLGEAPANKQFINGTQEDVAEDNGYGKLTTTLNEENLFVCQVTATSPSTFETFKILPDMLKGNTLFGFPDPSTNTFTYKITYL